MFSFTGDNCGLLGVGESDVCDPPPKGTMFKMSHSQIIKYFALGFLGRQIQTHWVGRTGRPPNKALVFGNG